MYIANPVPKFKSSEMKGKTTVWKTAGW